MKFKKSSTTGFVVERQWEIDDFIKEKFWSIICTHKSDSEEKSSDKPIVTNFNWARGRLFDYEAAVILYELVVENPTATVMDINGKETFRNPPLPLNTGSAPFQYFCVPG